MAEFYSARGWEIPPLPWTNLSPPFSTAASWLLHQLRRTAPRRSPWRTATFETLRRAFLKIAVRIEELNTRIKIALPSAYPYRNALIAMAASIAAQGP